MNRPLNPEAYERALAQVRRDRIGDAPSLRTPVEAARDLTDGRSYTPRPAKVAYARRAHTARGEAITFTSWDRADNDPWGWVPGWVEDGHVLDGYTLIHVAEPSWRVREPVALKSERAA